MTTVKKPIPSKGIVPYVPAEADEFQQMAASYKRGEIKDAEFTPWRLRRGIYGQRQPDMQMVRVKIPGGILTADALDALGELAEKHTALKKGHITTRENIQFHHVPLQNAPDVMRLIGQVGLTTREACGNTVRNVVSCPLGGVCRNEVFDLTPYMVAYVRRFVRHPVTQNMPRKWKTSFSPCASDCAIAPMHDLGFIAVVRDENGVKRKGFKMLVGGGTAIMPKYAQTLYEFVPVEDFLRVSEAALRVFNQADDLRKNKAMARVKVLVHRIGIDRYRELVEEELKKPWAREGDFDPTPLMEDLVALEEAGARAKQPDGRGGAPPVDLEFGAWRRGNAIPQRQAGFYTVSVKVTRGDLTPAQFHGLADLTRKYAGGQVRLTYEQNLAVRWVREHDLYDIWKALKAVGLAEPDAHDINDVCSCPGTDSCKLGITSSMGLAAALRESFKGYNGLLEDPLVKKLHVKMSGCPNGCGRHHIANIGFQGAMVKGPGGQQVPAFEAFLGGAYENGETRYGQRLPGVKLPAKRVPEALKAFLEYYKANRRENEEFNAFYDRVGSQPFVEIASRLRDVGPLNKETIGLYMDWGKTVLYKVERGEGECAV